MVRIAPLNLSKTGDSAAGPESSEESRLLHSLPAVVLQCSQEGRILFVSDNWFDLTGCDAADSAGQDLLDFILPEDHSLLREHFSGPLPLGPVNNTLRYLSREGRSGWIQLNLHETLLADGSGGYIGLVTDITDQVGREASLLAQHRTLSGILDDLPGMVFRCRNDPDWTMEYVSRGSVALTGYRPGEIINNRRLSYGSLIVPEDREKVWNAVQMAIHEQRGYDLDYRIEAEGGDIRHVWERGKGIYSASNDLLGLEGFITDITRYRQRFRPLRSADLYLDDGVSLTRPLLSDRVRHRLKRLERDLRNVASQPGFGLVCIYFDNLGIHLTEAGDGVHARMLEALVNRTLSLCTPADSLHIDVTGQILLLLDTAPDREFMARFAKHLQESFFDPVEIDELQILLTLSIGAVWCESREKTDALMAYTEECMRRVHETGGNGWRVSAVDS